MKIIKTAILLSALLISVNCFAQNININQATASEISKALKGVGIKKAELIVEHRKKHGKFKDIQHLVRVKGIGRKIIAQNKDKLKLK